MDLRIKRILSAVVCFCLCFAVLQTMSLNADAAGYYGESSLSGVKCSIISNERMASYVNQMMKYHIMSSADNYRVARNLKDGKSIVFFFDGCSDNVDHPVYGDYFQYHLSAYCAVIKAVNGELKVVFESENCSTIPDNPRSENLNSGRAVPTVLDGVYNIYSINHLEEYAALHIADNQGVAPAIRCDGTSSYTDSSQAINIHARSKFKNVPHNGVGAGTTSSTGCFNVGRTDDEWEEYNAFIYAVLGVSNARNTKLGSTWADKGLVIVDRSMYKAQLKQIYGGDNNHSADGLVAKITAYTDKLDYSAHSSHTYAGSYHDAAHPHNVYQMCFCGSIKYTGAATKVSSCDACNPVSKQNVPFGALDEVRVLNTKTFSVRGWSADQDDFARKVDVHIVINGQTVGHAYANQRREDVQNELGIGADHGYQFECVIPEGTSGAQTVEAHGIDVETGLNFLIDSQTVNFNAPFGALEEVVVDTDQIIVGGWSADPDDMDRFVDVHIVINGQTVGHAYANQRREDLLSKYGIGAEHGYRFECPLPEGVSGTVRVEAHGIDAESGLNYMIDCKTVSLSRKCICSGSFGGTYITTAAVDVLSGHDDGFSKLTVIPKGTAISVSKAEGLGGECYGHVTYNGVSGYVSMKNVHVDLGADFYAYIILSEPWMHLTNDQANVSLRSGTGAKNQVWHFLRQNDGSYKITSVLDGKCLEIADASTAAGANVRTNEDKGTGAQRWYIGGSSSQHLFSAKCAATVMEVANTNYADGSNVLMSKFTGNHNQRFHIWKLDGYNSELPPCPQITFGASMYDMPEGEFLLQEKITVNWHASNADSYWLQIRNNKDGSYIINEMVHTTSYSFRPPVAGSYTVAMRAYNEAGDSGRIDRTLTVRECAHSYGSTVTLPTCTDGGCTTYTCKLCGNSYRDGETDALGHNYTYTVVVEPTELDSGVLAGTCSGCDGMEQVMLPKLDTGNYSYAVYKNPTIAAEGIGRYTWKNTAYGNFFFDAVLPRLEQEDSNDPQILVECVAARAGDTVRVAVKVKNNPGIASVAIEVDYDDMLTLTDVEYNAEVSGQSVKPNVSDNPTMLLWLNPTENVYGDWTLATLVFQVDREAEVGSVAKIGITYDPDDIYAIVGAEKEESVAFTVIDGSVTVTDSIPGDINGDGKVNNRDATRLMQYLAGWNVEVVEAALDVNGDGKCNNRDATRLMQHLAGWDVEIC